MHPMVHVSASVVYYLRCQELTEFLTLS
jgi:hypothetical protein